MPEEIRSGIRGSRNFGLHVQPIACLLHTGFMPMRAKTTRYRDQARRKRLEMLQRETVPWKMTQTLLLCVMGSVRLRQESDEATLFRS